MPFLDLVWLVPLFPLLGAALRLSNIQSFAAEIGRRYGLDARAIALSAAQNGQLLHPADFRPAPCASTFGLPCMDAATPH